VTPQIFWTAEFFLGEPVEIKKIDWNGLASIQIDHGEARMVIISEFGPRIAFFGLKESRNLLFWDEENRGRKDWLIRGGHRVWNMTKDADETEMTYAPDNDPCTVEMESNSVTVWGKLNENSMSRRGLHIGEGENGAFIVTSQVENAGDMLLSCGVWGLTCTLPEEGTRFEFPLGDGSGWDTFKSIQFRRWGPCDGEFGDTQFKAGAETFTVKPAGRQAKQMFHIPKAEGIMLNPKTGVSFKKEIEYDPHGHYPDGCNFAMYIGNDNWMVEFETMGPLVTLKPGMVQKLREVWTLG